MAKYTPKPAPLLLKLENKFTNSKSGSIEKHLDEWIMDLESFRNAIDKHSLLPRMTDQDFMIHGLNNFTEE